MKTIHFISIILLITISSCVSQKKHITLQNRVHDCEDALKSIINKELLLENNLSNEKIKSKELAQELAEFKNTNKNLLERILALSVVNKTEAKSIKKSLDALSNQYAYIKNFTHTMLRNDSLNIVLVKNLKKSLNNFNNENISIEVKKGIVSISIANEILFRSGSSKVNDTGEKVIEKIAETINAHQELTILVEGHTDTVRIHTTCIEDNWDLSSKRASAVVRLMQTSFSLLPERMTAAGRSEFVPKASNKNAKGRAINRRTEIIFLTKIHQFLHLLN